MARRIRKIIPVNSTMDETLFNKIQSIRREFNRKNKISISNAQASRILSMNIKNIKVPLISLGLKNVRFKKQKS